MTRTAGRKRPRRGNRGAAVGRMQRANQRPPAAQPSSKRRGTAIVATAYPSGGPRQSPQPRRVGVRRARGLRFSAWGKRGPPRALARMSGHGLDLSPAIFWVVRTIALGVGERAIPNNSNSMSDSTEVKVQRWERYIEDSRREAKLLGPRRAANHADGHRFI
jgi:hypothetical protein